MFSEHMWPFYFSTPNDINSDMFINIEGEENECPLLSVVLGPMFSAAPFYKVLSFLRSNGFNDVDLSISKIPFVSKNK